MRLFFASLTFTLLCLTAVSCFAQEQPIWIFTGAPDGANPSSAVVVDGKSGNLYGVTLNGGANKVGAVFQLTPPARSGGAWTESLIYSFQATGDGQTPLSLVENQQTGDLYGTTLSGGSNDIGVVFQLSKATNGATWTESILYNFHFGQVVTGLAIDSAGNLYAMLNSFQVVEYSPPGSTGGGAWTQTVLFAPQFPPAFGITFQDPLIPGLTLDGSSGSLFGSVPYASGGSPLIGGPYGLGSLFQLSPPASAGGSWSYGPLYYFELGSISPPYQPSLMYDGILPSGALVVMGGQIFGTTAGGGVAGQGTLYLAQPPINPGASWSDYIIHSFTGGNDGESPVGGLVAVNGWLYGTTSNGGVNNDGTIFEAVPLSAGNWVEVSLYSFLGGAHDGATPYAPLTSAPGNTGSGPVTLYGTTFSGGASNNGTVFQATFPQPPSTSGPSYVANCNLNCFENSSRWRVAPPIWVLGPEAVGFEGVVEKIGDDGLVVEMRVRPLPGRIRTPEGPYRSMKATFDRRVSFKVGQRLIVAAKGPVVGLSPQLQVLGVWQAEKSPR